MENKKFTAGTLIGVGTAGVVAGCIIGILIGMQIGKSSYQSNQPIELTNEIYNEVQTTQEPQYMAEPVDEGIQNIQQSSDKDYSSIISNRSSGEIEEYIISYVRPMYEYVNENLSGYSRYTDDAAVCYNDDKGCIRKEFAQGSHGNNMYREYYYDTDTGRVAFAYLVDGDAEWRLYFRTNQLVRCVTPKGVTIDNPTQNAILEMAWSVLNEAY